MAAPLIVGAGPTGLAAALFLAGRGVACRIVERRTEPSTRSKAFGVNPRTLDLLEPTGVTERLLAAARPLRYVNLRRGSRHLFRLDLGRARHRFPFMLVHSQADTEAALGRALADRGTRVERGVTAVDVRTDGWRAVATLRGPRGGGEEVEAEVLLGADGPRSTVRAALGLDFAGSAYPETWWLYDVELDPPLAPDEAHAFLLAEGFLFAIRIRDHLWRVVGNVPGGLERLPPGTRVGPARWESEFRIAHRLAERLRVGPVCLAGDAAHVHSPLGARGMNMGIEDAYVFAAVVSAGRAEDYARLRRPVVAEVVRRIAQVTELPRGRSRTARLLRRLAPVLGPVGPLLVPISRRPAEWLLGIGHPVRVT